MQPLAQGETGEIFLDHERANALVSAGIDQEDVTRGRIIEGAVGDEHLAAVEVIGVPPAHSLTLHA